jgi:uncharacterized membrane protein YheB (UPF0754 family)
MAANTNNRDRGPPLPASRTASQMALSNAAEIDQQLTAMKETWISIGQTYDVLHEQSVKMSSLCPTMQKTTQDVQTLREQIRARVKEDDVKIKKEKASAQGELNTKPESQIVKELMADIKNKIKSEIKSQVTGQVDIQIKENLPAPLQDQLDESRKHVEEATFSLKNAEARRKNSALRISRDLEELLSQVVTASGTVSGFFPVNLKSLFTYNLEISQNLARDYKLHVSDVKEENWNSFMSHIGIRSGIEQCY